MPAFQGTFAEKAFMYHHKRRYPLDSSSRTETLSRQGPVITVPFDGIARYLGRCPV